MGKSGPNSCRNFHLNLEHVLRIIVLAERKYELGPLIIELVLNWGNKTLENYIKL